MGDKYTCHGIDTKVPNHFYWPDLDIDLTPEIIEHPERFLLKSR